MSEKQPKDGKDKILELVRWVDKQKGSLFKRFDAFHGLTVLLMVVGTWLFPIMIVLLFGTFSVVDKTIIGLSFVGVVVAFFALLAQLGGKTWLEQITAKP